MIAYAATKHAVVGLSLTLANVLGVRPGDMVTVDVLEGNRPTRRIEVSGLVDDLFGLSAYMDIDALHRMMQEGDVTTGALMLAPSLWLTLRASRRRAWAAGAFA